MQTKLAKPIRRDTAPFNTSCIQWFFVIDITLIHTGDMERCTSYMLNVHDTAGLNASGVYIF